MPEITLQYRFSALEQKREYYLSCDSTGHWYFWLGYHLAKALRQRVALFPWSSPGGGRIVASWRPLSASKAGGMVARAIMRNEAALDEAGKP